MALLNLLKQRKSVRRFSNRPVEREKIVMCLEAVRLAPSAFRIALQYRVVLKPISLLLFNTISRYYLFVIREVKAL